MIFRACTASPFSARRLLFSSSFRTNGRQNGPRPLAALLSHPKREPSEGNATQNVNRLPENSNTSFAWHALGPQNANRSAEMRRKTLTVCQKIATPPSIEASYTRHSIVYPTLPESQNMYPCWHFVRGCAQGHCRDINIICIFENVGEHGCM